MGPDIHDQATVKLKLDRRRSTSSRKERKIRDKGGKGRVDKRPTQFYRVEGHRNRKKENSKGKRKTERRVVGGGG